MSKYSVSDFREAQFARTEDGLVAMRAFPDRHEPWIFVTTKGTTALRTDSSMPREDWIPVTGRTITESERDDWTSHMTMGGLGGFDEALERLGFTVVPDPEPTNAEKLEPFVKQIIADVRLNGYNAESAAYWAGRFDVAGVKAPGGDDE